MRGWTDGGGVVARLACRFLGGSLWWLGRGGAETGPGGDEGLRWEGRGLGGCSTFGKVSTDRMGGDDD